MYIDKKACFDIILVIFGLAIWSLVHRRAGIYPAIFVFEDIHYKIEYEIVNISFQIRKM